MQFVSHVLYNALKSVEAHSAIVFITNLYTLQTPFKIENAQYATLINCK